MISVITMAYAFVMSVTGNEKGAGGGRRNEGMNRVGATSANR